jgi:hypothetical protein
MNNQSKEFNKQLELDVLVNGLTEVTQEYVERFEYFDFTEVVIPEGIKTIGMWAFAHCCNLTKITIPDTVTSIGQFAFSRCSGLKNLTLPKSVTNIGKYAFYGCHNIKNYF